MSGLKIIFHKSEVFCFCFEGEAVEKQDIYSMILTCQLGSTPIRYLGIPVHNKKLRNSDRKRIENQSEAKLACWKGKLLSIGGRLILLNACLRNVFVI